MVNESCDSTAVCDSNVRVTINELSIAHNVVKDWTMCDLAMGVASLSDGLCMGGVHLMCLGKSGDLVVMWDCPRTAVHDWPLDYVHPDSDVLSLVHDLVTYWTAIDLAMGESCS